MTFQGPRQVRPDTFRREMEATDVEPEVTKRDASYWRDLVFSRLFPALFFSIFLARLLHDAGDPLQCAAAQARYRPPPRGRLYRFHGHLLRHRGRLLARRRAARRARPAGGHHRHHRPGLLGLGPCLPTALVLDHPRGAPPGDRPSLLAEPPPRVPRRGGHGDRDQSRHSRVAGRARHRLLHRLRALAHPVGGGRAFAGVPRRVPRLCPGCAALRAQPAQDPKLTRLADRLTARTLLLAGVMIVIPALFVGAILDPDFWWHIRIGRWMVENGHLPTKYIFTYTAPSHVWTDHEYLTEMLMWLVYSKAGALGIGLAFGAITYAGFYLMHRQVRRQPFVIAGLGLALGAIAGAPIWGPRAQMITFALTCLELYWLQGYLSGRS